MLAGHAVFLKVIEHSSDAGVWKLVLEPEAGEPMDIRYRIGDALKLPIAVGEQLWFNQSADAQGLVVRQANGALRALVVVDGAVAGTVEGLVRPTFESDRLTYTDVLAEPSGCMMVIDHHALELTQGRQRTFVTPGTVMRVAVPAPTQADATAMLSMDLHVLDVSRPTPRRAEEDARCPSLAHVSWLLLQAQ